VAFRDEIARLSRLALTFRARPHRDPRAEIRVRHLRFPP
jgi:hypothetical protein